MTSTQFQTLVNLHNDFWDESLMAEEFNYIYQRILLPHEREIVICKVHGLTNKQIAKQHKEKVSTIQRAIYRIKYKYRNGLGNRVDDSLRKKLARGKYNEQKKKEISDNEKKTSYPD